MKVKIICILLLVGFVNFSCANSGLSNRLQTIKNNKAVLIQAKTTNLKIYEKSLDIKMNQTMFNKTHIIRWIPGKKINLKVQPVPCACYNSQCGCCVSIVFQPFSINQTFCANLTYDPFLFAIIVDVKSNGNVLLHNVLSAKNPPAFCIPLPISFIPGILVEWCLHLYDIYTPAVRNVHFCMNWEIKLYTATVLVLSFDCLRLGTDGALVLKPGDAGSVIYGRIPNSVVEEITGNDNIIKVYNNTIKDSAIHFQNEFVERGNLTVFYEKLP